MLAAALLLVLGLALADASYFSGLCGSSICVTQYVTYGRWYDFCSPCSNIYQGGLGYGFGQGGLADGHGLGGYGIGGQGLGGLGLYNYGLDLGYGYGGLGYGGSGGGYGGLGLGFPSSTLSINKGHAGATAASGQSSTKSSSSKKSKNTGEYEQIITTRIKKTLECEKECRRSTTCSTQWAVAHSYWGSCSQCAHC